MSCLILENQTLAISDVQMMQSEVPEDPQKLQNLAGYSKYLKPTIWYRNDHIQN